MHGVDEVPVFVAHLVKGRVSKDARIVDKHVDAAKGVNCRLDYLLTVFNRVVVSHGRAARLADLVDHNVGRLGRTTLSWHGITLLNRNRHQSAAHTLDAATQVVHHNLGATLAKEERVRAPKAAASARDNNDAICGGEKQRGRGGAKAHVCL